MCMLLRKIVNIENACHSALPATRQNTPETHHWQSVQRHQRDASPGSQPTTSCTTGLFDAYSLLNRLDG